MCERKKRFTRKIVQIKEKFFKPTNKIARKIIKKSQKHYLANRKLENSKTRILNH